VRSTFRANDIANELMDGVDTIKKKPYLTAKRILLSDDTHSMQQHRNKQVITIIIYAIYSDDENSKLQKRESQSAFTRHIWHFPTSNSNKFPADRRLHFAR
jgi:hypothetical protein